MRIENPLSRAPRCQSRIQCAVMYAFAYANCVGAAAARCKRRAVSNLRWITCSCGTGVSMSCPFRCIQDTVGHRLQMLGQIRIFVLAVPGSLGRPTWVDVGRPYCGFALPGHLTRLGMQRRHEDNFLGDRITTITTNSQVGKPARLFLTSRQEINALLTITGLSNV